MDLRKKGPLVENENSTRRSNQEQGMYQAIKRQRGDEIHTISVCVEERKEECRISYDLCISSSISRKTRVDNIMS